jgi:hypothetical protein
MSAPRKTPLRGAALIAAGFVPAERAEELEAYLASVAFLERLRQSAERLTEHAEHRAEDLRHWRHALAGFGGDPRAASALTALDRLVAEMERLGARQREHEEDHCRRLAQDETLRGMLEHQITEVIQTLAEIARA